MRRIAGVVMGLVVMSASGPFAQEGDPPRTIAVSGTVDSKTTPPLASANCCTGYWLAGKDMREAKKRNDSKIESAIALQKKLGIDEGDLEC